MKKAIRVFEPVTAEQLKLLHAAPSWAAGVRGFMDRLYEDVAALAEIPSMSALSKQEAAFLIGRLKGEHGRRYPAPARYENDVAGDASSLPSFYHVRDIRLMLRELAWDKAKIEGWLLKWRGGEEHSGSGSAERARHLDSLEKYRHPGSGAGPGKAIATGEEKELMKEYSEQAQSLLELLTEPEMLQLRKHHPFKVDRNDKIRELHRRGAAQHVLAEICGMSNKAISKICKPEQPAGQA